MTKNNLKVVKSTKEQEIDSKEKNKALEAAISQITDNFGKGSVMKLGQKKGDGHRVCFYSGSLSLDIALGIGGLAKRKNYRGLWSRIIWKNNFSITGSSRSSKSWWDYVLLLMQNMH